MEHLSKDSMDILNNEDDPRQVFFFLHLKVVPRRQEQIYNLNGSYYDL